jgi:SAM-dependent methyltransferase
MSELKNRKQREEFWGEQGHHRIGCQGRTPLGVVDSLIEFAEGKSVLEIGPGQGRQFERVFPVSSEYHIADISDVVLQLPVYESVKKTKLLNYDQDLGEDFDVIHFWYVVHHVLTEEIGEFFSFIHRHLRLSGRAYFNYPLIQHFPESSLTRGGGDGMKTTDTDVSMYESLIQENFDVVESYELLPYSFVTLQRKSD